MELRRHQYRKWEEIQESEKLKRSTIFYIIFPLFPPIIIPKQKPHYSYQNIQSKMKLISYLLLIIGLFTLAYAQASTFASIQADLATAQTGANGFKQSASSTSATAATVSTISASLSAISNAFVDASSKIGTYQGTFTQDQIDTTLTIFGQIRDSITAGTASLTSNKAAFTAVDTTHKIADGLGLLDSTTGSITASLVTVFTANAQSKVKTVGQAIENSAYNTCQSYGGSSC